MSLSFYKSIVFKEGKESLVICWKQLWIKINDISVPDWNKMANSIQSDLYFQSFILNKRDTVIKVNDDLNEFWDSGENRQSRKWFRWSESQYVGAFLCRQVATLQPDH